jgi:mono/diheme cytochrome c family protein
MRHVTVSRLVVGLAGLLASAALAFAWIAVERAPDARSEARGGPPRGQQLHQTHCAACHGWEVLVAGLAAESPQRAAGELLAFLEEHGAAAPEEDAAIVAELLASAVRR